MFTLISEFLANILNTNTKFIWLKENNYQIIFIQYEYDIVVVLSNIYDLNESLNVIRLFKKGILSVLNTNKSLLVWLNIKDDSVLNITIINI